MAKAQPKKPTSKAPAKPVELSQGQALIVDLSEVEEMSFENLPKANYPCVIDELTFEYSQNNNPMWRGGLEVERGEYAGRKLFTFITFSEAALPIAKKHISRIAPELLDGPFDPEEVANGGTLLHRRG